MRRVRQEGEWGFGSRRLALLATVLAMLAAAGLFVVLRSIHKDSRSHPDTTTETSVSTEIPAAPQDMTVAPSSLAPIVPPIVALGPTPTPTVPVTQPRVPVPARTVAIPPRERTPAPAPAAAPSPRAAAAPVTASRPYVQPSPEPLTTPTPGAVQPTPVATATASPPADRKPNQGVDRRDARREANEAADALRDLRPR